MRIASNFSMSRETIVKAGSALFVALSVVSPFFPESALAQAVTGATSPIIIDPAPKAAEPSATPQGASSAQSTESLEKSVSRTEDKVIDSARDIVKKLDSSAEETALSDLNKARQTVSRIEAMIDVEKRLNELDRLRNERRGTAQMGNLPAALAGAIPASALGMPNGINMGKATGGLSQNNQLIVMPAKPSRPSIARIIGTNGKYTAVLKMSEKEEKTVKVGDKVSDGETVRSITSSSVEIGGKGTSYTLNVKNVDVVYSVVR